MTNIVTGQNYSQILSSWYWFFSDTWYSYTYLASLKSRENSNAWLSCLLATLSCFSKPRTHVHSNNVKLPDNFVRYHWLPRRAYLETRITRVTDSISSNFMHDVLNCTPSSLITTRYFSARHWAFQVSRYASCSSASVAVPSGCTKPSLNVSELHPRSLDYFLPTLPAVDGNVHLHVAHSTCTYQEFG